MALKSDMFHQVLQSWGPTLLSSSCSQTKLQELPLQERQNSVWTVLGLSWLRDLTLLAQSTHWSSGQVGTWLWSGRYCKPQITSKIPRIKSEFATGLREFTVFHPTKACVSRKHLIYSAFFRGSSLQITRRFLDLPRSRSTVFVENYSPKGLPGNIDFLTRWPLCHEELAWHTPDASARTFWPSWPWPHLQPSILELPLLPQAWGTLTT